MRASASAPWTTLGAVIVMLVLRAAGLIPDTSDPLRSGRPPLTAYSSVVERASAFYVTMRGSSVTCIAPSAQLKWSGRFCAIRMRPLFWDDRAVPKQTLSKFDAAAGRRADNAQQSMD